MKTSQRVAIRRLERRINDLDKLIGWPIKISEEVIKHGEFIGHRFPPSEVPVNLAIRAILNHLKLDLKRIPARGEYFVTEQKGEGGGE